MYVIRNHATKANCISEVQNLLACDPPKYDVVIKKHTKSKTSQQRRYFHKILQLICDYTGDDIEERKMQIKYRVLPLKEVVVEGTKHLHPISSEKATVQQYSDLIEAALMLASAADVSIPHPDYYGFKI